MDGDVEVEAELAHVRDALEAVLAGRAPPRRDHATDDEAWTIAAADVGLAGKGRLLKSMLRTSTAHAAARVVESAVLGNGPSCLGELARADVGAGGSAPEPPDGAPEPLTSPELLCHVVCAAGDLAVAAKLCCTCRAARFALQTLLQRAQRRKDAVTETLRTGLVDVAARSRVLQGQIRPAMILGTESFSFDELRADSEDAIMKEVQRILDPARRDALARRLGLRDGALAAIRRDVRAASWGAG